MPYIALTQTGKSYVESISKPKPHKNDSIFYVSWIGVDNSRPSRWRITRFLILRIIWCVIIMKSLLFTFKVTYKDYNSFGYVRMYYVKYVVLSKNYISKFKQKRKKWKNCWLAIYDIYPWFYVTVKIGSLDVLGSVYSSSSLFFLVYKVHFRSVGVEK